MSNDASAPESPERRPIDLISDSGPSPEDQLRMLLRSRLLLVSAVFLMVWVARAVIYRRAEEPEYLHVPGIVCFVVMAALLLVLRRADLSLRALRVVEFLIIAIWCLRNTALYYYQIEAAEGRLLPGDYHASLPWFTLIVCYGALIPASWQRSAVVALGITLLPVLLTIGLQPNRELSSLLPLLWQLGVASAICIFSASRIHALTEEALEARKLGQYRLKTKLGQGGMGEVYLAEHQLLHRPCAIKVIRADRLGDPAAFQRFEREVRATARLTHGNIVRVFDFGRARDGTFFCVMEYLPGMDLDRLVERYGPIPAERAVYILRQLCGALREAHAAGLIHRDIKPTNIILCERGMVYDVAKLVDFGLVHETASAEPSSKLTEERTTVGTPHYMSPEQISGKALTGASDIYSLGAVAYFLITGHTPFEGGDYRRLFAAHLTEPAPPVRTWCPAVPADVEKVIMRCLEKKPVDRFADAQSLGQALADCVCAREWTAERAEAWWREYVDMPSAR
jgi:tRNA A-37 threonylcarbamoyl transferase component Bud32